MDPTLTGEQQRMRDALRDFLEAEGGLDLARSVMDGDHPTKHSVIEDLWADLAEMDVTALAVPAAYGGLGEDIRFLVPILEIAGRVAMPGPYPETMAFAIPLLQELGTAQQRERHLETIASGERTMSFAIYDDASESVPACVDHTAEPTPDGFRLTGRKLLVPYGAMVDTVVVAARTREGTGFQGISLFIVPTEGLDATRTRSLDKTRPMYELDLDGETVPESAVLGSPHCGGDALARAIDEYSIATAAMLVGGADYVTDSSIDYATEREQYGNPIGMYQAVKHRIAEMWMDTEQGRSLVYYAAWAHATDAPDARRAVSAASAFTTHYAERITGDNVLNHGGIGFTWDHDAHIHLKQAKGWKNFLGSPEWHLDRVADMREF
jgi:acyl-CoA dehydrogenase